MKKILFLLLVSLGAFGQRNGLIDADTTTRPKAGLSALAFSSGQLKIIRNTGNSYGVITSNNSYINPSWLSSIALAKVTGLTAALGAKSDTSHTYTTAKITDWTSAWAARFAAQSTSGLTEGSNLYYTDARVGTYGDARYGRLASANSWTGSNTFIGLSTSGDILPTTNSTRWIGSSGALFNRIYVSTIFSDAVRANNTGGVNFNSSSGAVLGKIFDNGNFFLGSSPVDAGYRLEVNGAARVSGKLSVGTPSQTTAVLEVTSTTQGFLPPRMTQAQRNAISSPATGLTLYCTDCTAADTSTGVMQTYNGSTWKNNW